LVLALLSNRRPWGPIEEKLDNIETIFFQYDPDKLQKADPAQILLKIKEIKLGNISINKQIKELSYNIEQFKRIIKEFGSLDMFLSKNSEEAATMLSDSESPYKLKNIGPALVMEYLRNVGIAAMKPDTHLLRICGSNRLAIFPSLVSIEQAKLLFNKFAEQAELNPSYLDNLFWIFGAKDYANICSAKPKCNNCELASYCNYPKNNQNNL
jgi:endonuclease III